MARLLKIFVFIYFPDSKLSAWNGFHSLIFDAVTVKTENLMKYVIYYW